MERIWLKSYPEGVPADINPTAYGSLGDFFAASVERYRDRAAYVSMKRTMTYGELDSAVARLRQLSPGGRRPAAQGARRADDAEPAAISGRAVRRARAGYVVVNCNPLYSPRELHHQLVDSGAEAIVVLENFAQTLEKAIEGTEIREVIVTGAGDLLGALRGAIANFVVRRVRRAVPPLEPAAGGAVLSRAGAGTGAQGGTAEDRAGRSRLPAIYRRDDRRAEGRDADASQHDRQPSAGRRLDRRRSSGQAARPS